jgi:hypothetical protein
MTLRLRLATSARYSPSRRVIALQGRLELDAGLADALDGDFLRFVLLVPRMRGGGDNESVADPPAADWFGQDQFGTAGLGGGPEFHPRPTQR